MRVLLTGSSGFIGARLAGHLRSAGHDVVGLDLCPGPATTLRCDLRDPAVTCIRAHEANVFIHFAAKAGVGRSLLEPQRYVDANVTGTVHALQLAAHLNVRRFVFASSSSVYGRVDGPANEDRAPSPLSPYAESKVAAEALCRDVAAKGTFDVVVLRPFTVYGPGQRPDMFCHQALTKTLAGEELRGLAVAARLYFRRRGLRGGGQRHQGAGSLRVLDVQPRFGAAGGCDRIPGNGGGCDRTHARCRPRRSQTLRARNYLLRHHPVEGKT
jgi:nucleoside-diphosphate-sugar epimerase